MVLKPASNQAEAEWGAKLFAGLEGPGFRVPKPIRSNDGGFVSQGWTAWRFVAAEHAGPNGGRWPETIAACRAFHAAIAGVPRPAFLDDRSDAWAEADRLAFGEKQIEPLPVFRDAIKRLTRLLKPVEAPSQLIHGDFTANVLFAEGEAPCVIDFSPYWRPVEFALGVVISDALSWTVAPTTIVHLCDDVPQFAQWMARATLRRVWENDQHVRRGRGSAAEFLAEYLPTIATIEELVAGRRRA